MSMTDPIADLLTRIRNACQARHSETLVPRSKFKLHILEILREEGYIASFEDLTEDQQLKVLLRYTPDGKSLIRGIHRISRPGRRHYVGHKDIAKVKSGIGMAVLSTSHGLMTDSEARAKSLGGEVLFEIY